MVIFQLPWPELEVEWMEVCTITNFFFIFLLGPNSGDFADAWAFSYPNVYLDTWMP